MKWIVLGSSKEAARNYPFPGGADAVITTNRGILLEPNPDYYGLFDSVATEVFVPTAYEAQSRGVKLITLERNDTSQLRRKVTNFDIFLPNGCRGYEHFSLSGICCLEFAAKRAEVVYLIGMEGYQKGKYQDQHFPHELPPHDLEPAKKMWISRAANMHGITRNVIEPKTQAIVDKYPQVEFVMVGSPNYTIVAPNWKTL